VCVGGFLSPGCRLFFYVFNIFPYFMMIVFWREIVAFLQTKALFLSVRTLRASCVMICRESGCARARDAWRCPAGGKIRSLLSEINLVSVRVCVGRRVSTGLKPSGWTPRLGEKVMV